MNAPPDPLDPLLDRWAHTPPPSPRLSADVWQRIALTESAPAPAPGLRALIESWFARPSFAVLFVASCAMLGLFLAEVRVSHLQRERSTQLARSYLALIDPLLNAPRSTAPPMKHTALILVLGLAAGTVSHLAYYRANEPTVADSLAGQLGWMKTELRLTDEQFARIRELHEASSPRLRTLASQVGQMQTEFAEFEKARRTSDRVDFLEFARFVEARRAINHECQDSTRQLVAASAGFMTPQQRQQYIRLVATVDPFAASLLN